MKTRLSILLTALMMLIGMSAQAQSVNGDVNNDGQVNKSDINAIVDIIMEKTPSVPKESADVNNDGKVNAADIVYVVNETFRNQSLVISFKNGTKACYKLDNLVNTTFTTDALVVTTDKKSVSYPLSEVSQYTYESVEDESDDTNFGNPTPMTDSYEYFTINFTDGTKSEKFYNIDVDYICYSKKDINGIECDNWQVQEIKAKDGIYRYSLSQIDNISFKNVYIEDVAKDIANILSDLEPLFMQCETISEFSDIITSNNLAEIEEVSKDGQALSVKIKDFEPIYFINPPKPTSGIMNESITSLFPPYTNTRKTRGEYEDGTNHYMEAQKACIVNQPYNDEDRTEYRKVSNTLCNAFETMGINCKIENKPMPEFFYNEIFGYDLVFIITHGFYLNNKHWLYTGEELLLYDGDKDLDLSKESKEKTIAKMIRNTINNNNSRPSLKAYGLGNVKEIRNGKLQGIIYTAISEDYIKSSENRFSNNSIIFNAACESMKSNYSLGELFIDKGASCYLGYTDSNSIGHYGGAFFYLYMLNGKSTDSAFSLVPINCKEQDLKQDGNHYQPILKIENDNNLFIIRPQTISAEYMYSGEDNIIKIGGSVKILSSTLTGNTYGFHVSTYSSMEQYTEYSSILNYDNCQRLLSFTHDISVTDLKPNTTYYYRAYMNDGYSYCYGDIKSFTTTGDDVEDTSNYKAYVLIKDSVWTYYFDDKMKIRDKGNYKEGRVSTITSNISITGWEGDKSTIVVFDPSFYYYKPTKITFGGWSINKIEGLRYLNTSEITDMSYMFAGCKYVSELDLSNFDTRKVTNMFMMFWNCSSLKSLDLSSFNTSNVTDMGEMFSYCTLMILDLSSFNTSKVNNMNGMFMYCHSLTNLNISNFNTANVTNMRDMFGECKALKSINTTSFITDSCEDMSGMFWGCANITSLDLSSFNLSNVKYLASMFSGCISIKKIYVSHDWKTPYAGRMFTDCNMLTGEKGTKLGKNLYGYDINNNPLYYYCSDSNSAAHIDGGKDNPGLFTAK